MAIRQLELAGNEMKRGTISAIFLTLAMAIGGCSVTGVTNLKTPPNARSLVVRDAHCLSADQYAAAVQTLSSPDAAYANVAAAQRQLVDTANISNACRAEVIAVLMDAMDKPNLDFTQDERSFVLWQSGAEILGDLKATESLDLLISHLGLTLSTFSSSMKHQPALLGVIKMGPIAIPKLSELLKNTGDSKTRYSAIYCIADIGGQSAVVALREALASESDDCAKQLILVSLDSFDASGVIKDRAKWLGRFICK